MSPPRRGATTFLTVTLLALVSGAPAHAGSFNSQSDIFGLNLSMTREEARAALIAKYGEKQLVPLPSKVILPNISQEANLGFAVVAKSAESPESMDGFGPVGKDVVHVYFDPNPAANGIYQVTRTTGYGSRSHTTLQSLNDSLREKYGQPTVAQSQGDRVDYIFALDPAAFDKRTCIIADYGGFNGYLMSHPDGELTRPVVVQAASNHFVDIINALTSRPSAAAFHQHENCGTVLEVYATLQGPYVTVLQESLVDISRGSAAIMQFTRNLYSQSNDVAHRQLQKDTGNKPEL